MLSKCFVLNILPFKTKKWKVLFFKILLFRPSHSHLFLFPNKQTFNDINRLTAQKVRPWEAQQTTDKCQYEEANTKTLKFFLKRGSNRCAGTKIRKAERTVLDQLGWTQKGDAIPNLRVTLREGKRKYKTNLAYVIVFLKVRPGGGRLLEINTVDPWATRLWAVQVHLYMAFSSIVTYYRTTGSVVGWIRWCGTMDTEADYKLYLDFWLHRGSTPLTANPLHFVQGSPVFSIITYNFIIPSGLNFCFSPRWTSCYW